MKRLSLFLQPDGGTINFGTRGRADGLDTARGLLVSLDGDEMVVRVPGHKESFGYDRLHGGTYYGYVKAATHTFRILDRYDDRYGVTGFDVEHLTEEGGHDLHD